MEKPCELFGIIKIQLGCFNSLLPGSQRFAENDKPGDTLRGTSGSGKETRCPSKPTEGVSELPILWFHSPDTVTVSYTSKRQIGLKIILVATIHASVSH